MMPFLPVLTRRLDICARVCAFACASFASVAAQEPSYGTAVRPILSENCFPCHGPDAASRKADLRLDDRAAALAVDAFVPGKPEQSLLMARIRASDPGDRMPPADSGLELDAAEIETLRKWITSGAPYEEHWAFRPLPKRVALPPQQAPAWARGPIDRFVHARMRAADLEPSPPAERWRWLRRVSFDLTGLPPRIDELRAFEADKEPGAYERVVDRLLAKPAFGEHMAVAWLDLARYADSYGYQSDGLMPTWPYRDWVVRAFNANRGFDRFVFDQIAGDQRPDATREQRLGTAFNRLHRQTNEGGSIREEYRVEYAADRVRTFGTAFLGLTLECARCHDHKFDPVSQRDYYALFAFFNSIDENGLYHDSSRVPTPSLLLPDAKQEKRLGELEAAVRRAERKLGEARTAARVDAASAPDLDASLKKGLVGHYPLDRFGKGRTLANLVAKGKAGRSGAGNRIVAGKLGNAIELSGDDVASFPGVCGALRPHEPFTISFWMRPQKERQTCIVLHRTSGTDVGFFGTELSLQEGRLRLAVLRHWPGNAMAIETEDVIPHERWTHIAISSSGTYSAKGLRIFVDGQQDTRILRDALEKKPGHGGSGFDIGQRFRDFGFARGAIDELRAYDRALSTIEVQTLAGLREDDPPAALRREHALVHDAALARAARAHRDALRALFEHRSRFREISVMRDTDVPKPTFVLARGAYDAPKRADGRVVRATPSFLPARIQSTADSSISRADLAQWLTRENHPLLARVTVNRVWQRFFGRGLVATADDFGAQGALPSHPQLLDWLARDFVASAWNYKRLCKQIVLSASYRQSSACTPERRRRDPDNVLLARGPSRRLSAEQLRDQALFVSGLLDASRGGPPVSPYQPKGLWRESNVMTPAYRQSAGRALYRRSLYSVWKRTSPLPNMLSFDATTREFCTVQRSDTNTPLQALVLLNDVQFVEAARVFAERTLREAGSEDSTRLRFAFELASGRAPTAEEASTLLALLRTARQRFAEDAKAAGALLGVGDSKPGKQAAPGREATKPNPVEHAAWTIVTQSILNLDASTWKR